MPLVYWDQTDFGLWALDPLELMPSEDEGVPLVSRGRAGWGRACGWRLAAAGGGWRLAVASAVSQPTVAALVAFPAAQTGLQLGPTGANASAEAVQEDLLGMDAGAGPQSSGSSRSEDGGSSPAAAGSPRAFDPLGALPRAADVAASGTCASEQPVLAAPASSQLHKTC